MRVNHSFAVDFLGPHHGQEFDRVFEVSDSSNVAPGIELARSHQLQGASDVPRKASTGAGDVDFLVMDDTRVEGDNVITFFQAPKEVQDGTPPDQFLRVLDGLLRAHSYDDVIGTTIMGQ